MRARLGSDSTALPPAAHLLPAVDESQLLSMHLILNAHGILHTIHREHTEGVSTWPLHIAVDASDFERATVLVRGLQLTPPYLASWSRSSFRLFAVLVAVLILGAGLLLLLG